LGYEASSTFQIVSVENGIVTGWAALTPFSSREVYRGVAEVSIYVASRFRGKKTGSQLMDQIIISLSLTESGLSFRVFFLRMKLH